MLHSHYWHPHKCFSNQGFLLFGLDTMWAVVALAAGNRFE